MAEYNPYTLPNSKQLLAALEMPEKGRKSPELRVLLDFLDAYERARRDPGDTARREKVLANVRTAYDTWSHGPPERRSIWQRMRNPFFRMSAVIRELGAQLAHAELVLRSQHVAEAPGSPHHDNLWVRPADDLGQLRDSVLKSALNLGSPYPSQVRSSTDSTRTEERNRTEMGTARVDSGPNRAKPLPPLPETQGPRRQWPPKPQGPREPQPKPGLTADTQQPRRREQRDPTTPSPTSPIHSPRTRRGSHI